MSALRLPGARTAPTPPDLRLAVVERAEPVYFAGPENQLVAAAIARLIEARDRETRPGAPSPGPLTLIGPPGCGKSLLASGVQFAWAERVGQDRVVAITANDLRRQHDRAIAGEGKSPGSVERLEASLSGVRLLVIENLEGLADSPAAVELVAAVCDHLSAAGGRLLVTAGRPLGEIAGLSVRLVGRLSAGLTLEVAAPAEGARCELLTAWLATLGGRIETDAAQHIAGWLPADARRVIATAEQLRERFGVTAVIGRRDALAFIGDLSRQASSLPLAEIATVVAKYYHMPLRTLRSSSRKAPVVLARAVTIYLARQLTPLSYEDIGRYLGGRDHTTVMHNFQRIDSRTGKDRALRSALDDLLRRLGRADLISAPSAARRNGEAS